MNETQPSRTTPGAGLSRRRLLIAAGAGGGLGIALHAGLPVHAMPAGPTAGSMPLAPAHPAMANRRLRAPWLDCMRDDTPGRAPSVHWFCQHGDAAALHLHADGTCSVDEPGWGRHCFTAADFATGAPQETVRRILGEQAVVELERERALLG